MYIRNYPAIEAEYALENKEITYPEHPNIEFIPLLEPLKLNHPILQLLVYLDNHSDEKLYLEDIIQESGFPKHIFCPTFRKLTGTSFASYMILLRIYKARYLYLNSSYTGYQICFISPFCLFLSPFLILVLFHCPYIFITFVLLIFEDKLKKQHKK